MSLPMPVDRLLLKVKPEHATAFVAATAAHLSAQQHDPPRLELLRDPGQSGYFVLVESHFDEAARAAYAESPARLAWREAIVAFLAEPLGETRLVEVFSTGWLGPALTGGPIPEPEAPRRAGVPPRLPPK